MIVVARLGDLLPPGTLATLDAAIKGQWLEAVAAVARDQWVQLAGQRLSTTRRDYIQGIQAVDFTPGTASISLLGTVPNLIEQGQPAYDMHDTLLGPNVPVAPVGQRGKHPKKGGGYYRAIPFRHATPGTTGAVGPAMGSAYSNHWLVGNATALGKSVYDKAKRLKATTGMPGQKTAWGGRLPAGMAPKLKSHHATDIYAGMVKQTKAYKSATQSQYTTFRTISTGSRGWMRPATEGVHFARDVGEYVQKQAQMSLNQFLTAAQKGT